MAMKLLLAAAFFLLILVGQPAHAHGGPRMTVKRLNQKIDSLESFLNKFLREGLLEESDTSAFMSEIESLREVNASTSEIISDLTAQAKALKERIKDTADQSIANGQGGAEVNTSRNSQSSSLSNSLDDLKARVSNLESQAKNDSETNADPQSGLAAALEKIEKQEELFKKYDDGQNARFLELQQKVAALEETRHISSFEVISDFASRIQTLENVQKDQNETVRFVSAQLQTLTEQLGESAEESSTASTENTQEKVDALESLNFFKSQVLPQLSTLKGSVASLRSGYQSLVSRVDNVSQSIGSISDKILRVRLVGGKHVAEGRLEVYIQGEWGTVCNDLFGVQDARMVCRMLGFSWEGSAVALFEEGTGPIWMDDVQCSGIERNIFECARKPEGVHNCQHSEDVGVICRQ